MQLAFLPASFAFASAGNNIAARMAMMAMTTSSSINVKPRFGRCCVAEDIWRAVGRRYCGLNLPQTDTYPSQLQARNFKSSTLKIKGSSKHQTSNMPPRHRALKVYVRVLLFAALRSKADSRGRMQNLDKARRLWAGV